MMTARRLPAAWVLALAACASAPPPGEPPPPVPTAVPPPPAGIAEFTARQHERATAAARDGRWREAALAWDVLAALAPADPEPARRRTEAERKAQAAAAERLQRARDKHQRGDADAAGRLYLEVLALVPAQPDAADALRAIERQRVRRQPLGVLARTTLPRRGGATPAALPTGGSQRNEIEHASLLAGAGEIDAAITLLRPLLSAAQPDPVARQLVAELYFRRAEALNGSDRAALDALRLALQADPSHAAAAARLKALTEADRPETAPPDTTPNRRRDGGAVND